MTPKTYLPKDYDIFIGLDVDKNSFAYTVQDHEDMKRSNKTASNTTQFNKYIQNHYGDKKILFAYEAGPTGYHLYDYLTKKKHDCLVVSPLSIPKAPNQKVKNNRIDSVKICEELKAGKLKSIHVPQNYYRELRHLINLRENYANTRKVAKQRIKALLLHVNLYKKIDDSEQNWSNNYIKFLRELRCSEAVRQRLDMLLMDLDYARRQTTTILRQLRAFVKSHKEINQYMEYLMSLPGIGFIIAITVLGRIGNPKDLNNVRELPAFLGLVPRERSTGDDVDRGSITHLGNRTLRSLLIEAAWMSIRLDKQLDQFYHRVKRRHHPRIGAKKAIVAVARKLTQRIYCVLKERRRYIVH